MSLVRRGEGKRKNEVVKHRGKGKSGVTGRGCAARRGKHDDGVDEEEILWLMMAMKAAIYFSKERV
ncbi:MAG: hypothetical protein LBD55_04305 [Treponema sp.]|nr:hypothetical protein [Treponema sp.]